MVREDRAAEHHWHQRQPGPVGAGAELADAGRGLFAVGSLDAVADVAGNAHALRVERAYCRSILNALHGVWSIGAVVGGTMGAAAAGLRVPLLWEHAAGS